MDAIVRFPYKPAGVVAIAVATLAGIWTMPVRSGTIVALALVVGLAGGAGEAAAQARVIPLSEGAPGREIGAFTPEGPRLREQLWLIPTGPGDAPRLRATLFRPPGPGPFRLAIVNHNSSSAAIDRIGASLPSFFFLSRFLVGRGFAVVVPLRRGYGSSEGAFNESIGPCAAPNYLGAGAGTSADIEAVADFMLQQPFVRPGKALLLGTGAGGWGALALAARAPDKVAGVVGFGAGRGAVGPSNPGAICEPERLAAAARQYGAGGPAPVLLLHAEDDRSIGPAAARAMHAAYVAGGGRAQLVVTRPVGNDQGANMLGEFRAVALWQKPLEAFLAELAP